MAKGSGIEAYLVDQASRHVLVTLRDAINTALNGTSPRKRGRPRKARAVATTENGEPKRKRGRPKKVVAESTTAAQAAAFKNTGTGSREEHQRVREEASIQL
jgi:hypothetical protein